MDPRSRSRLRWMRLLAVVLTAVAVVVAGGFVLSRVGGSAAAPRPTSSPSPTSRSAAQPGGPALRVLGLGDSVTSGSACACADYVTGFGRLLSAQEHRAVTVDNEGEPGATSDDLLAERGHDRGLDTEVRRADVVLVTIGANDLQPSLDAWRHGGCSTGCYQPGVSAMGERVGRVVSAIDALRQHQPGAVLVTTYWNVFTDGDVARKAEDDGYLRWSDAVTRAADTAICRSAVPQGATCVDLYTPFKGAGADDPTPLLADDGDHPDPAGTALISRTVLAALGA